MTLWSDSVPARTAELLALEAHVIRNEQELVISPIALVRGAKDAGRPRRLRLRQHQGTAR